MRNEFIVDLRHCNNTLNTNAVLARGLKYPAHKDTSDALEITIAEIVEQDSRIFTSQFHTRRRQGFCSGGADVVGDGAGTDEGYVGDLRVRCQMFGDGGPARYGLHEVGGVAACGEGGGCDACKVGAGPGGGFGAFDDDAIASEDGGDYGGYEVVELL